MFTTKAKTPVALLGGLVLAALVAAAPATAQPYGGGWQGWGPGMMMGPGMMGPRSFARMCDPRSAGFADWRFARIEEMVKPTEAQRPAFEALKEASAKAQEIVRAACPTEVPATVIGHVEAMEKRLEGMLQAMKTIRQALDAFYASLSDEQKARFDAVGPRTRGWRGGWSRR